MGRQCEMCSTQSEQRRGWRRAVASRRGGRVVGEYPISTQTTWRTPKRDYRRVPPSKRATNEGPNPLLYSIEQPKGVQNPCRRQPTSTQARTCARTMFAAMLFMASKAVPPLPPAGRSARLLPALAAPPSPAPPAPPPRATPPPLPGRRAGAEGEREEEGRNTQAGCATARYPFIRGGEVCSLQ